MQGFSSSVSATYTCLLARIGDGDRTAFSKALEEPLLHWVVIQRAVDINRPEAGPVQSPVRQERLGIELTLHTTPKDPSRLLLPLTEPRCHTAKPAIHLQQASGAATRGGDPQLS